MSAHANDTRSAITIRPYVSADAAGTLEVFLSAITETASADYSPEQVEAWASPAERDPDTWSVAMLAREGFVADIGGTLAGFSDVGPTGYIDMLFVAPRFLRRGVASALVAEAERRARVDGVDALTTDASITARPVFEHLGFVVEREQHPVRHGVELTNFRMRKSLLACGEDRRRPAGIR